MKRNSKLFFRQQLLRRRLRGSKHHHRHLHHQRPPNVPSHQPLCGHGRLPYHGHTRSHRHLLRHLLQSPFHNLFGKIASNLFRIQKDHLELWSSPVAPGTLTDLTRKNVQPFHWSFWGSFTAAVQRSSNTTRSDFRFSPWTGAPLCKG